MFVCVCVCTCLSAYVRVRVRVVHFYLYLFLSLCVFMWVLAHVCVRLAHACTSIVKVRGRSKLEATQRKISDTTHVREMEVGAGARDVTAASSVVGTEEIVDMRFLQLEMQNESLHVQVCVCCVALCQMCVRKNECIHIHRHIYTCHMNIHIYMDIHPCVWIHIYMCVCVRVGVYIYVHKYIHDMHPCVYICIYICIFEHMHVCVHIHTYIFLNICIYIYVYVYTHTHTRTHAHAHTHIHTTYI